MTSQAKSNPSCRGVAYVLALLLLAIFSTLAVVFASTTDLNLQISKNWRKIEEARLAAESGLGFMNYVLLKCNVPSGAGGQSLLDSVANHLSSTLDGSDNLQGKTVGYDEATITVPQIAIGNGRSFSAEICLSGDLVVHLSVTGRGEGPVERTVGMNYQVTAGESSIFDYGVASKSAICITGNARIQGANSSDEASILSATYSNDEALKMIGNARIDGDVHFSNPNAYATLTGNISIGGESLWGGNIQDHIHAGIESVEFPEVDPSVFEPFATNIVNSGTATSGNKTFDNIRIVAGTNPTFSGNIKLNGVIFIEAPNNVQFTGNLTVKGVIVTQDAGEGVYDQNTIKFTGNTSVQGVESLPDTPEFHDLREMPGSFLLAPGFGVDFTGNFGTVSGTMAADKFTFTGNAGGTVHGSVINYSDSEFNLTGNSNITIDRSGTPDVPPGFALPSKLAAVPISYQEY